MTFFIRVFPIVLIVFTLTPYMAGQTVTGAIFGKVTDATQAAVPGAEVTVINQETGAVRTTLSNDVGFYDFPALVSGVYTVTAEMPGFKKYEQTDVPLSVSERVRVDLELAIGEITEAVTVSAGTVMVDTRSAEISSLVDDQRITDLPLAGRNVISLASLLPGITEVSAPTVQGGSRSGPRLASHGSRRNQNYFTLNGSYFSHPSRNTGMNPPPPDAVREFRIKTNNFGAAEGRNAGAVVAVVTRGGTNEFHGSVWEFHRNDNLNARSFFQEQKAELIRNQFGAAAGGPVIRDKVFLFGTYEGYRQPGQGRREDYVPLPSERAGDFSDVSTQLVNPYTGEEFPGNQIPTSLFDSASLNYLERIPLPNQPDGERYVNYYPSATRNNLYIIRNDINISDTQSVFWHFYHSRYSPDAAQAGVQGWNETQSWTEFNNVAANHTWTVSPTLVNQASFGFVRNDQAAENLGRWTNDELGIDMPDYTPYAGTKVSVSGRFSISTSSHGNYFSDSWSFSDAVIWTKDNHTLKFGGEFFRLDYFQAWLQPPTFSFNGGRTGDPMADFMLGAYRSIRLQYGRRKNDTVQPWYWSFYFQDEWRVSPRLTLTLGMRYELPSPWNDRRELALSTAAFPLDETNVSTAPIPDPPPGYLFANYDLPAGLVEADKNNFAPRLGFAWDTCGDGVTSIRGGAGFFYDTSNADTLAQVNAPLASSTTVYDGKMGAPCIGVDCELIPPSNFDNPDVSTAEFFYPFTAFSTDLNLRNTYFYHWNLGVQRQLTRDLMVSIDYIGKIGRKMLSFYPWNPAIYDPNLTDSENRATTNDRSLHAPGIYASAGGQLMLSPQYDSWYHGMDLMVNKRMSDGLSVLGSFTWSKAIDQNSTDNLGGDTPNPFDIKRSEQGLADFHRLLSLSISGIWEPFVNQPFDGFAGYLLSGWTFGPIFRATTGDRLEFGSGEDRGLVGFGGQHASVTANPAKSHSSNISKTTEYFDTSVFYYPDWGSFGNAAKGLITGPGFMTFDLAILRDFPVPISEESRIQFRGEFFNLFNWTNFSNPTTGLSSSRFGQIRGSGSGRTAQLGLKFIW